MSDEYQLLVSQEVQEFLEEVEEKTERIVRENLEKLSDPYPGRGLGDKEKITWRGEEVYRLHIGRTWTAFYDINESEDVVEVLDILPIDQAHSEYGDLD
ncbi:type II toxin-antitoxin system RelE/ParE family toxin [Salinarchaeum laminariae]|uniref:type II toxin-antitoxin system RelE/ParE family toxin n=1 Tax=Salinarchaeum laminariae TaxID=869888 RepID=UPI0020C097C3|nr:type II toxin-antitoxin system RelE/ParE family toxin [Salinarchaeum laminariae]